jgi:hypothetical protein
VFPTRRATPPVYGGGEGGKCELEDLLGPGGGAYFRARSGSNRLRLRLLRLRAPCEPSGSPPMPSPLSLGGSAVAPGPFRNPTLDPNLEGGGEGMWRRRAREQGGKWRGRPAGWRERGQREGRE